MKSVRVECEITITVEHTSGGSWRINLRSVSRRRRADDGADDEAATGELDDMMNQLIFRGTVKQVVQYSRARNVNR